MKKLSILIIILISGSCWGQQEAMYTHYSFNTLSVNPGYAGSRGAMTATFLNRVQWVGFEGAPLTQTFTIHTPVYKEKLGLGLSAVNDKIGPTNTTYLFADFAYRILFKNKSSFSFGLKGGVSVFSNRLESLTTTDPNDLDFSSNIKSLLLPNFGVGLYYQAERFYAGISVPKLLENNYKKNTVAGSLEGESRHYTFIMGSMLDIAQGGRIKLKPSLLVKAVAGAPVELDLTALLYWRNRFWLGPMWRSADAIGVLIGGNITPQLGVGYSFDWSYALKTVNYHYGSHELMLRYDFLFKNSRKIESPRYF